MNIIHLKIDKQDSHTHYTIFIDGASAGSLVLRSGEEADAFEDIVYEGCVNEGVVFELTPLPVEES